jgi:phenylpyruvate tautomerase PptA (4-oxalocrotonate tautomerase family)
MGDTMPTVTIETWPIPKETKKKLIEGISQVFVDAGIDSKVMIVIHEPSLDNWGSDGKQHSEKHPEEAIEREKLLQA